MNQENKTPQPHQPIVFSTDPTLPDPFQHWHGDFNPNPDPQSKVKSTKTETRIGDMEHKVTITYSTDSFANRQSSIITLGIAKAAFFISILPALGLLIQTCLVMPESPTSEKLQVPAILLLSIAISSAFTISQYKRKLK